MARTTPEIYNEITTAVAAKGTLADFNVSSEDFDAFIELVQNESKAGNLRNLLFMVAAAHHQEEVLHEEYIAEIDAKANAARYATDDWWVARMLDFQYGDVLQVILEDGELYLKYATTDASKRIISRCSVKNSNTGNSVIKVAKGNDPLIALDTDELNALKAHVRKLQIPGTSITVVSQFSDKAKYNITAYYDAEYDKATVIANTEEAIIAYHKDLNKDTNSLDGRIDLRQLEDRIQDVPGMVNFVITNAEARSNGGSFIAFNREYETSSGYVEIDPNHPLSSTIQYLPYGIEV